MNRQVSRIDRSFREGTYAFDLVVAFVARRSDETFEAVFAVELSLFFYESNVLKRPATLRVHAHEMIGAPDLSQSGDERPPK